MGRLARVPPSAYLAGGCCGEAEHSGPVIVDCGPIERAPVHRPAGLLVFAQMNSMMTRKARSGAYREVQTAYDHAPVPRLYLMRGIYVADKLEVVNTAFPWFLST